MIAQALSNLSDIALCVSNDFHTMHLNYAGAEYDSMHKEVLKTYYEQAADDYDTWAEAALMFVETVENGNDAAKRQSWQPVVGKVDNHKEGAVQRINTLLDLYCTALLMVFKAADAADDCYKCVGIANTLQTRIEYWSKEKAFFNARRVC